MGCHHEEGVFQLVSSAIHRNLSFLHHLKQGRLRFGRGAVDFVDQHHVGEDRASLEGKIYRFLVEYRGANHVAGHQVGGKLDARKFYIHGLSQQLGGQGFGDAGYPFEQYVPIRQHGRDQQVNDFLLPHNDLAQLDAHLINGGIDLAQVQAVAAPVAGSGFGYQLGFNRRSFFRGIQRLLRRVWVHFFWL